MSQYLVIGIYGQVYDDSGICSNVSTICVFDTLGNQLHWSNGLFVQDDEIREMLGQRAGNVLCFNPELEVAKTLLKEDPALFEEYCNYVLDEEVNSYLEVFRFRVGEKELATLNEGRKYY